MRFRLRHRGREEEIDAKAHCTIADVLKQKNLNQETFLIKLNGKIAHEDTVLKEGDELECWNVVYGG